MTRPSTARINVDDPESSSPERNPRSRSSILIVDDEAVVRTFLGRCLENAGYHVKQAESATEALELMIGEPPALVLCDIRLPGQDGLWLTDRIHAHWPRVPIVMATAVDDVQTIRRSRELGAVDYIAKPIQPVQLLELISRVTAIPDEVADDVSKVGEAEASADDTPEAEYTLETPVRCPACGERVASLRAVRLVRAKVNFTSTLPRRGRVVACPHCLAIVPAELTNF